LAYRGIREASAGATNGTFAGIFQSLVAAWHGERPDQMPRATYFDIDDKVVLADEEVPGRLIVTLELRLDRVPGPAEHVGFLAKSVDGVLCYPAKWPDAPAGSAGKVFRQEMVVEGPGSAFHFIAYLFTNEEWSRIDHYLKARDGKGSRSEGLDCPQGATRLKDLIKSRAELDRLARRIRPTG